MDVGARRFAHFGVKVKFNSISYVNAVQHQRQHRWPGEIHDIGDVKRVLRARWLCLRDGQSWYLQKKASLGSILA